MGTVVPRASGGVILAMHHGFASLDLESELLGLIAAAVANILLTPEHGRDPNLPKTTFGVKPCLSSPVRAPYPPWKPTPIALISCYPLQDGNGAFPSEDD